MKISALTFTLIFASVLSWPRETQSATVTGGMKHCEPNKSTEKGFCAFSVEIIGELDGNTVAQFSKILDDTRQARKESLGTRISINSPGGNVKAAMDLGSLMRRERMPLMIDRGAICASACIFVLAGAVSRAPLGQVKIHRPYFTESDPLIDHQKQFESLIVKVHTYLRQMNVSEQLAEDMLRIEPAHSRTLSTAELDYYGLTELDPSERELRDIKAIYDLGIDRREYIRRQMIAERDCRGVDHKSNIKCHERVMKFGW